MGVIHPPESEFAQESRRWEAYPTEFGPPGRPFVHHDYPAMMYKATHKNPWEFESHLVADEREQRNLESRGFVAGGQGKAVEAYDQAQFETATAAARRNYEDRNMSEAAQAEAALAEEEVAGHLGAVPETPIRRGPGRPPKAKE